MHEFASILEEVAKTRSAQCFGIFTCMDVVANSNKLRISLCLTFNKNLISLNYRLIRYAIVVLRLVILNWIKLESGFGEAQLMQVAMLRALPSLRKNLGQNVQTDS